MRETITSGQLEEIRQSESVIICYSHCMWCGRRTPHEWCHACTKSWNKPTRKRMRSDFWRAYQEAEPCDDRTDNCPLAQMTRHS